MSKNRTQKLIKPFISEQQILPVFCIRLYLFLYMHMYGYATLYFNELTIMHWSLYQTFIWSMVGTFNFLVLL